MSPSFQDLPLELRRLVYEYLLSDNDTCYPKHPLYGHRLDIARLRPMYCTSLFTVSKQISEEAIEFFYENGFVAAEDFFQETQNCHIPLITVNGTTPRIPVQNFVLMISMRGAQEIENRQYMERSSGYSGPKQTIVFAVKHLNLFMAMLPYVQAWRLRNIGPRHMNPPAVKGTSLTFTFGPRTGEYDFPRVSPRSVTTVRDALGRLRDFPTSQDAIEGKIAMKIDGNIDQKLADDLLNSFRSPMKSSHVADDLEFLLREGNARRDSDQLKDTAHHFYGLVRRAIVDSHNGRYPVESLGGQDDWLMRLELIESDLAVHSSIALFRQFGYLPDYIYHFQGAIERYKALRYSTPSDDRLAEFHFLCGEMYIEYGDKCELIRAMKGQEAHERHKLVCMQEALQEFQIAQRYNPHDQAIAQKIQKYEQILADRWNDDYADHTYQDHN
ncbi:hypothetical protein MMC10_001688 [Thelotrema lepadinum]|nr:hypothetical protein [Thelotrema lepadinum]